MHQPEIELPFILLFYSSFCCYNNGNDPHSLWSATALMVKGENKETFPIFSLLCVYFLPSTTRERCFSPLTHLLCPTSELDSACISENELSELFHEPRIHRKPIWTFSASVVFFKADFVEWLARDFCRALLLCRRTMSERGDTRARVNLWKHFDSSWKKVWSVMVAIVVCLNEAAAVTSRERETFNGSLEWRNKS